MYAQFSQYYLNEDIRNFQHVMCQKAELNKNLPEEELVARCKKYYWFHFGGNGGGHVGSAITSGNFTSSAWRSWSSLNSFGRWAKFNLEFYRIPQSDFDECVQRAVTIGLLQRKFIEYLIKHCHGETDLKLYWLNPWVVRLNLSAKGVVYESLCERKVNTRDLYGELLSEVQADVSKAQFDRYTSLHYVNGKLVEELRLKSDEGCINPVLTDRLYCALT
jgi:hypothetical protein